MTVFLPKRWQNGGLRPEFHAPTRVQKREFIAFMTTSRVQLNGGLDYRSNLSNNASLTEGSYSQGIDAY